MLSILREMVALSLEQETDGSIIWPLYFPVGA